MLRRDDDNVLRVAMNLEVSGKRKQERPKKTWKKQVEEEISLKKEDALNRDKWRDEVREIAEGWVDSAISAKGQHLIKTELILIQQTSLF